MVVARVSREEIERVSPPQLTGVLLPYHGPEFLDSA